MTRILSLLFLLILLTGCVMPGTPRPSSGSQPEPDRPRLLSPTHTSPAPVARPGSSTVLAPLRANPNQPFGGSSLAAWTPGEYSGTLDALPVNLLEVGNFGVITGLTYEQQYFLGVNGFVVAGTQEQYFHEIRDQVARVNGQPYYLTTDAAYHALDLTLEVLLSGFEREVLLPQITTVTQVTLQEAVSALDQVTGTDLETDAHLAAAYMAVALKLLDPQAAIDARLEPDVKAQIQQIETGGHATSVLLPAYSDDFDVYEPAGGDEASLENAALHQGLTWFERAALQPGRAPQILTLALRRASIKNEDASQVWARLYETIHYLNGSRGGYGPLQYAAWMDEVYGSRYGYADISDGDHYTAFLARASQPPSPENTRPDNQEVDANWRFFPQSYRLDEALLSATPGSGLYLMAGLGSATAQLFALDTGSGEANAAPPPAAAGLDLPASAYLNDFNNSWLYAFQSQLSQKNEAFPPYMRTHAWSARDLNAALSAWAGWKHSAPFEVDVPEPQPSPTNRVSGPAPAYVEPNPDVFFRLAYLSQSLVDGLRLRGYTSGPNQFLMADPGPMGFDQALFGLSDLAKKFAQLGAIAARELEGKEPTEDERWLILSCLGPVECSILRSIEYGDQAEMPSTASVTATGVTRQGGQLQAATGKLDRIFVAVPLEGKIQIAQGGVLSYYEFARSAPYSTEAWRKAASNPPDSPKWTSAFRFPGGAPATSLAMRSGDILLVTPNGDGANLRAGPSTGDAILQQLVKGDLLTVQAGPVEEAGFTWWFVRIEYSRNITGWVAGDPLWFERIY
jgi:hypothetical protein